METWKLPLQIMQRKMQHVLSKQINNNSVKDDMMIFISFI